MLNVTTENKTGADCTGNDGAASRVLTLSNTGLTQQNGLLVYASGLALTLTTDYTITHSSTGSTITFVNKLWNDMAIIVKYYQQRTTTNVYDIMRDDIQGIITEHGTEATLIRQTETTDSVGGVTAVSEEEYAIYTMIQDITKKDRQIHEMGLAIPGNSKAFFFHEYLDEITGNGTISVEVGDMLKDTDAKYWRVEQIIAERKGDAQEIFRVGIIKKIDLSV